jgi:hypothetical protein
MKYSPIQQESKESIMLSSSSILKQCLVDDVPWRLLKAQMTKQRKKKRPQIHKHCELDPSKTSLVDDVPWSQLPKAQSQKIGDRREQKIHTNFELTKP